MLLQQCVERKSLYFPLFCPGILADLFFFYCRYKPDVNIRFITEELGFESDEQTARFVLDNSSEELLEERNGAVRLLTGKAGSLFDQAKAAAHRVVDIKGQI